MSVLAAYLFNTLCNFAIGLLVAKFLGPAEYGRFALAFAVAIAVQVAFFDWLRLGATRFYSERVRTEDPALRATLDTAFVVITFAMAISACLLLLSGVRFTLSNGLIALSLVAAVSNGMFDYNTALVRARFHNRLYLRLIIVKNALALFLTGGGAFFFGSAKMALVGSIISLSGSIITARASLHDDGTAPHHANLAIVKGILRYSLPIVAANLLYLAIPLANRSIVAIVYGFSETGQFSLAYDIGSKAVQAIASTLDVVLFQIAVALHERDGPTKARAQVANNMAIVIAIVLPTCTGIWLILPSIEHVIVPVAYRGPFAHLLTLMMAGLFSQAIIQFGINPIFQIAKRTAPLVGAAVVACFVDVVLIYLLPKTSDASGLAIAQTGAYIGALCVLIAIASLAKPQWPRPRDIVLAALGTGAMTVALLPLREHDPGLVTLAEQVIAGTLIYGGFVAAFDVANMRAIMIDRLRPIMARLGLAPL
ncbi:MAG TPA: lipopolysaccharide biosynthesis protein [Methylovirgula sp.]|nr:lipopolysaccharide biosynthesis protein [Methylovirgula sp.]